MTLSIRLDQELERDIERRARVEGISKSALVRRCLEEFFAECGDGNLAWELGKDVFGRHGSGRGDLSKNRRKLVREKIHARKGAVRRGPSGRVV